MPHTVVVRGHVVGLTTVEVDQPIPQGTTEVEVVLHLPDEASKHQMTVGEYVRQLPPGNRSKEDIDRQIDEDRGSWDE